MNATHSLSLKPSPTTTQAERADLWLKRTIQFWFAAAVIGLLVFAVYLLVFYGAAAQTDGLIGMAKNKRVLKGYVTGDARGNLMFLTHALLAALVVISGLVQLVPAIRQRLPALHRWSGRFFLLSVLATSLGGLYLTWVRATNPTLLGALAITLNALLIFGFGFLSWRAARARDFQTHRAWALRAFIVSCGVWFQRVGYIAWFILWQGPVGITKKLDGPFDMFWSFGSYLLPLALLELYLRAQTSRDARLKRGTAAVIAVFTVLMALGIVGATLFLWLPLVRAA